MGLPIDVIDHPDPERPAEPSATVVLLRDAPAGELEVLMIHRGVDTAFGGMWAFPGGVIEPDDVPEGTAPDPLPAARRAAVRETHEEVGIELVDESLVYWSHWLPPDDSRRRFSTWFFLAAYDGLDEHRIEIEHGEILEARWLAPANALAMQASGEALIAPPTFVTLEQLARYGDVAAALGAADPAQFHTEIAIAPDGARICLWEGDAGYGIADPLVQGPRRRLVMDEAAGWRYLVHG